MKRQYWTAICFALLLIASQVADIYGHYRFLFRATSQSAVGWIWEQWVYSAHGLAAISIQTTIVVLAHVLPALLLTVVFRDMAAWARPGWRDRVLPLAAFLIAAAVAAACWNRILNPRSMAFPSIDLLLIQDASTIGFSLLNLFLAFALAAFVVRATRRAPNRAMVFALAIGAVVLLATRGIPHSKDTGQHRTNLVVIGVDSLRPDHLGHSGFPERLTPAIDRFIDEAVLFEDTLTPLARTFPASISILSGRHPHHHGARFNLLPRDQVDTSVTYMHALRSQGYTTIYATDEVRFSNIDTAFGFDAVVSPRPGVRDWAFGATLDFVPTNLLARTPLGAWLFPYTYGNRAARSVYDPESFSDRLDATVARLPRRGVFLAAHFCLPHWPYVSAPAVGADSVARTLPAPNQDSPARYRRAVALADRQVGRLLESLEARGVLEDAIVVLLSDHGEGLGMTKDRLVSKGEIPFDAETPGHGSNPLSASAHQVLLAFRRYGEGTWPSKRVQTPASLVDVGPTLFELAGLGPVAPEFDGMSLVPWIRGAAPEIERDRYAETEIFARSVLKKEIREEEVASEMARFYTIAPDERIELRHEHIDRMLSYRQRAVWRGSQALASYFGADSQPQWLYVDRKAGTIEVVPDPISDDRTRSLHGSLCAHFRSDAALAPEVCPDQPLIGAVAVARATSGR
jgi:hypothetical protein